jgi:hypothetical protein
MIHSVGRWPDWSSNGRTVLTFDIGDELATVAAGGTGEAVIPGTLWGDVMSSWCPTVGAGLDAHRPGEAVRASHGMRTSRSDVVVANAS